MLVTSRGTGAITEILERWGAVVDQNFFTRYEEAIKNALKWRRSDLSSFISKKVVFLLENLI